MNYKMTATLMCSLAITSIALSAFMGNEISRSDWFLFTCNFSV